MKKFLLIILTLSMLLSLFACNEESKKNDGEGGGKNEVNSEIKVEAWTTHLTDKQIANVKSKPENASTVYDLYMMRGETEGCQLLIYSSAKIKKSFLDFDSDKYADKSITANTYVMNDTVTIKRKEWTDAAMPYYGRKIAFAAKKTIPFIAEFTTTKDTPAGDYTYTYEFKDGTTNEVYATFTVNVHVWDIVLPEEKTFATSVGINAYHIERFDKGNKMYKQYYDLLLEHNICGHTLPYDIMSEEAEAYMSDPNVTSFVIGLWSANTWTNEKVVQYYNRVKENPEWFKKAFFYVIDEPSTDDKIQEYNEICERFARLAPGIGVIAPFYTNQQMGEGKDQVDAMAPKTILWCPKLCLWDDSQSYEPFLDYTPSKTFAERMKDFQKEGDVVWSYVCNDPISPYAQLFIDTDGLVQRLMMWQHYQREIEGFLYWQTTSWGYRQEGSDMNPWEKAYNGVQDGDGRPVYGEGYLLYPGTPVGFGGPVASIRLKILRDGIDDIEMFYLAEKYLDKDWLDSKINEATPSLTSYTSEENFYKIRKEIGDALEAELKAK
ncbi:MAG: DUF4091 domain-containing protein [Clostridia bacterium]|nr:DUF4091 domain-containing protein [Clostridia bacterium]